MSAASTSRGSAKGKGKARAEPTERDPLLPSSSRSVIIGHEPQTRTPRWRSILYTILITIFSLLFAAGLFVALLAYSFKPSESELQALPKTAFSYAGPDNVQVLNVTNEGILVNVTLRCGIDVDTALGITHLDDDEKAEAIQRGERGTGAEWWESLRRWTASRALGQLSTRSIEVNISDPIYVFPRHFDTPPLLSLQVLDPLFVPLVPGVQSRSSWLETMSFTALARPIASTGQLWDFVQHAWAEGEVKVVVGIGKVEARLPERAWWAKYAQAVQEDLVMSLGVPVPHLPGLPSPGRPLNLSQLVHLDSYSFFTAESGALSIIANASVPNPVRDITATVPFGVPFSIALADGNRMAEVVSRPIHITSAPRISLSISGEITANLAEETIRDSSLSRFLQNYLHGEDNPIKVQGLSHIPSFARHADPPPEWLLDSMPTLSLDLSFPGPRPPPKIIQSVTIERMRLAERGGKMRASGTIIAEVELPEGMKTVDVDVVEVLPDVLVYDGEAGEEDADPDDPPPRAFGHIQPEEFLDAETSPSSDPEFPYRLIVRAPLYDIPVDVLPGRDKVLSDFVGKVVFRGGAQAGVKGTASVRVELKGIDGRVRLDNLPVKGEFWVGRQR